MNPIKAEILKKLNSYPKEFAPLKESAMKYMSRCCIIDTNDTVQIGHRPWVAPYNYAISLFAPAKKAWISNFQKRQGKKIPPIYQEFLLTINGCFLYDFSMYGLPPSMQSSTPLLDRSTLQCLDLDTANEHWICGYNVNNEKLLFGSRYYSDRESVGYFFEGKNTIQAFRKNGEMINEWLSFSDFLQQELLIAERMMIEETPEDWWD